MSRDTFLQMSRVERRKELFERSLMQRAEIFSIVGKYKESIRDFRKVEGFSKNPETVINASLGRARLYGIIGGKSKSEYCLKYALRIANKRKLELKKAEILNALSGKSFDEAKCDTALDYATKAIKLLKKVQGNRIQKKKAIAESLDNIGGIYSRIGKRTKALEFHKKSLSVKNSLNDKEGMAVSLNNIGMAFESLQRFSNALNYLKGSLKLRRETGYIQGSALCLNNIAVVYWKQGRFTEAIEFWEESLKIQRKLGNKSGIAINLNNLAIIYRIHGRFTESLKLHRESFKIRNEIGDKFGMTINLNQMGMIYALRGDYKNALLLNEKEGRLCKEIKNEPRLMNYYALKAYILNARKRCAESYELYKKALVISQKYDILSDKIRFLRELAQVIIDSETAGKKPLFPLKKAKNLIKNSGALMKKEERKFEYCRILVCDSRLNCVTENYKKALRYIEEAEKLAETIEFNEYLPEIYFQKSAILGHLKKVFESEEYRNKAGRASRKMGLKSLLKKTGK